MDTIGSVPVAIQPLLPSATGFPFLFSGTRPPQIYPSSGINLPGNCSGLSSSGSGIISGQHMGATQLLPTLDPYYMALAAGGINTELVANPASIASQQHAATATVLPSGIPVYTSLAPYQIQPCCPSGFYYQSAMLLPSGPGNNYAQLGAPYAPCVYNELPSCSTNWELAQHQLDPARLQFTNAPGSQISDGANLAQPSPLFYYAICDPTSASQGGLTLSGQPMYLPSHPAGLAFIQNSAQVPRKVEERRLSPTNRQHTNNESSGLSNDSGVVPHACPTSSGSGADEPDSSFDEGHNFTSSSANMNSYGIAPGYFGGSVQCRMTTSQCAPTNTASYRCTDSASYKIPSHDETSCGNPSQAALISHLHLAPNVNLGANFVSMPNIASFGVGSLLQTLPENSPVPADDLELALQQFSQLGMSRAPRESPHPAPAGQAPIKQLFANSEIDISPNNQHNLTSQPSTKLPEYLSATVPRRRSRSRRNFRPQQQQYLNLRPETSQSQYSSMHQLSGLLSANQGSAAGLSHSATSLQGNILYKTVLCRDYKPEVGCPRGDKCLFAHGTEDIHDPRNHDFFRTTLCDRLVNVGVCDRGATCYHAHSRDELRDSRCALNLLPGDRAPFGRQRHRSSAAKI